MSTMPLLNEPTVKRALVRIEYADGNVREFEVQEPYSADAAVTYPGRLRIPVLAPEMIPPAEAVEVEVSLCAYRSPVVVRTFHPDDTSVQAVTPVPGMA